MIKSKHPLLLNLLIIWCLAIGFESNAQFPEFKYHEIARSGNKMGQTSLADMDNDGDLDWVVGCRDGDIDICSKPWNGDLHIFLENQLISKN